MFVQLAIDIRPLAFHKYEYLNLCIFDSNSDWNSSAVYQSQIEIKLLCHKHHCMHTKNQFPLLQAYFLQYQISFMLFNVRMSVTLTIFRLSIQFDCRIRFSLGYFIIVCQLKIDFFSRIRLQLSGKIIKGRTSILVNEI